MMMRDDDDELDFFPAGVTAALTAPGPVLGAPEGAPEGAAEAAVEGFTEGGAEGGTEGAAEGAAEAGTEGATDGRTEGGRVEQRTHPKVARAGVESQYPEQQDLALPRLVPQEMSDGVHAKHPYVDAVGVESQYPGQHCLLPPAMVPQLGAELGANGYTYGLKGMIAAMATLHELEPTHLTTMQRVVASSTGRRINKFILLVSETSLSLKLYRVYDEEVGLLAQFAFAVIS